MLQAKAKKPPIHQIGGETENIRTAKRREAIVEALRVSMVKKGYAKTSLVDIAKTAELSPSHVLYYFRDKEAVLDELCDQILKRLY